MSDGRRTASVATLLDESTVTASGRQAPTMVYADAHGFVSSVAVTLPEPALPDSTTVYELPPDGSATVVEPFVGTLDVAVTVFTVLFAKQLVVPAGHSAVPMKKSQQSPSADLHGPAVPEQPEHTADEDADSVWSVHSLVPAGHDVLPERSAKHAELGCWQGPLEPVAQGGHERGAGTCSVSVWQTNAPAGQRPNRSAAAAHVPLA